MMSADSLTWGPRGPPGKRGPTRQWLVQVACSGAGGPRWRWAVRASDAPGTFPRRRRSPEPEGHRHRWRLRQFHPAGFRGERFWIPWTFSPNWSFHYPRAVFDKGGSQRRQRQGWMGAWTDTLVSDPETWRHHLSIIVVVLVPDYPLSSLLWEACGCGVV
jgi:hypothetical protein